MNSKYKLSVSELSSPTTPMDGFSVSAARNFYENSPHPHNAALANSDTAARNVLDASSLKRFMCRKVTLVGSERDVPIWGAMHKAESGSQPETRTAGCALEVPLDWMPPRA